MLVKMAGGAAVMSSAELVLRYHALPVPLSHPLGRSFDSSSQHPTARAQAAQLQRRRINSDRRQSATALSPEISLPSPNGTLSSGRIARRGQGENATTRFLQTRRHGTRCCASSKEDIAVADRNLGPPILRNLQAGKAGAEGMNDGSSGAGRAKQGLMASQDARGPATIVEGVDISLSSSDQSGVPTEILLVEEQGKATTREAFFNCLNILLGVGVLSIPYALQTGGWSAMGVLALLGIITNYTGKILGRCQERLCLLSSRERIETESGFGKAVLVRGLNSYEDIGEAAFGEAGRNFITGVLYVELIGTAGIFFILEGDNLTRLLGGNPADFMKLAALVFLPTLWLPNLAALSALGLLGALASVLVTVVLIISWASTGFMMAPGTEVLRPDTLPLTFGLLAFVYAGHAVFPNVKSSMRNPEEYEGMLDLTYLVVAGTCATVGIVGYAMFGRDVSQEVTLDLPDGILSTIATSLIVVNPFTKFALTLDPVARGVESLLRLGPRDAAPSAKSAVSKGEKEPQSEGEGLLQPAALQGLAAPAGIMTVSPQQLFRLAFRSGLGASTLLLALYVPFFAPLMALTGSCLTLCVSVIFPSLCYLVIFERELSTWEKWANVAIIIVGSGAAVAGTYVSVLELQ